MSDGTATMNVTAKESSTKTILAIDLGKFKSVACIYHSLGGEHRFETIATTPSAVHDLLVATAPSVLVMVPKQYESGQMNRLGRITGQGPGLLRRVLVQVAWGLQRREETRGHAVFERLCHGQRTRRKQAAVALARKILIWCWAILRDGSVWDESRGFAPAIT
jgi:hypothetical protein